MKRTSQKSRAVSFFDTLEDRRLMSASTLDTTFNGTGINNVANGVSAGFDAVVALPDGGSIAVGWTRSTYTSKTDFFVAKFKSNGQLDAGFGGGDGKVATDFGVDDAAHGVTLLAGGKFAVVGESRTSDDVSRFVIARYNANGTLDNSFSGDGKQSVPFAGGNKVARAAAVQSDGKLVVVGTVRDNYHLQPDVAVARLRADGTLDTTFNGVGYRRIDLGGYEYGNAVAVLTSDKILIGGSSDVESDDGNYDRFLAMRLTTSGAFDASFGGGDGWVSTQFTPPIADGSIASEANALAALPNGKFYLGGSVSTQPGNDSTRTYPAVARYNANGTLDASFSGDGKAITSLDASSADSIYTRAFVRSIGVSPAGKVTLVADMTYNNFATESTSRGLGLVRFTSGGSLDTTFSGDGKATYSGFYAVGGGALGNNGKLLVVGQDYDAKARIARFGLDSASTAKLTGTVYNDLNANGSKGAGEGGLAGWTVYVDANGDGVFTPGERSAVTNASGVWTIANLQPGAYRLREVKLDGWNRTQPAGAYPAGFYDVTVGVGGTISGLNFGNKHV